jgi:hypothetical protein
MAFQYMPPDGLSNKEYVHNHVFRDVVNDTWGTDFSIEKGEEKTETFTYTIPEDKIWKSESNISTVDVPKYWKPENMHIVAFVYTNQGVEQVVTTKLKIDSSFPPSL